MGADPEDVGRAGVFVLSPSDPETEALEEHEERSDKVWKQEAVSRAELFGRGTVPDSVHPFFQPVPFFYGGCCAPRWSRPRALHQCRQKQIASAAWCRSRGGLLPRGWKGATLRGRVQARQARLQSRERLGGPEFVSELAVGELRTTVSPSKNQRRDPGARAITRASAILTAMTSWSFPSLSQNPRMRLRSQRARAKSQGQELVSEMVADDLRGDCLVASTFTDAVRTRVPIDP